jgi:hypothetical protein
VRGIGGGVAGFGYWGVGCRLQKYAQFVISTKEKSH